jgi:apolipoprotein N-acyltransferase
VHADAAQLRAVETRRWIIRAMKTGISGIIDPYGREVQRSRSAEPVILLQAVHARSGRTPYVRWGAWPEWCALLLLAMLALRRPLARRRPG